MRRLLAIGLMLAAGAAVLIAGTGASDDGGSYRVRAIFDNASFVIPGQNVKIAGAVVGKIESLHVTSNKKAAVVIRIDKAGFRDFRSDAHCTIKPQSIIGEQFVECEPTQPRPEGDPLPPPLRELTAGPVKGERYLPVTNTSSPVGIDLVGNIMRLPERQRLTLILNELGTGLAGNGQELRDVIHRADPALRETDQVLAILASQNRTLAQLASDSDATLAPLARDKERVAGFIASANDTAQAVASQSSQLERGIQLLPQFLRELRPTLASLSGFSDQATPALADLESSAPALNRLIFQLGPFARAGKPALKGLGRAAAVGTKATVAARPVVKDLASFAKGAGPVGRNLAALTTSLHDTGGFKEILSFFFHETLATNGFDDVSHYLRAGFPPTPVLATQGALAVCGKGFAGTPTPPGPAGTSCWANFYPMPKTSAGDGSEPTAAEAIAAARSTQTGGASPLVKPGAAGASAPSGAGQAASGGRSGGSADARGKAPQPRTVAAGNGGQDAGATDSDGKQGAGAQPDGASGGDRADLGPGAGLLDYLLGGGGR